MPVPDNPESARPSRPDPRPRPRAQRVEALPDTGIVLGQGRARTRRPTGPRRRDTWILPLIAVVAVVIGAALVIGWTRDGSTASAQRTGTEPAAEKSGSVIADLARSIRNDDAKPEPTPVFASLGSLRIHLPVPTASVTALAFHQASFSHAMPLKTLVPIMSLQTAARIASQKRAIAAGTATATPAADASASATAEASAAALPPGVWSGKAIQLWRSGRSGKPDTAIDCGAPPGTPVLAPVDGTVVYVRTYKLYGKYGDYEVHISPKELPDSDFVVIHVTDVCVTPGQEVVGGVTPLAKVRLLSKYTGLQLRDYPVDGGDHTHIQLNRLPKPGFIWISTPGGQQVVPFMTSSDASGSVAASGSAGATATR